MNEKFVSILGVNFIHASMDSMDNLLWKRIKEKRKTFVVTANPEIVMYANQNKDYYEVIQRADYVTADGIGVVKAAQIQGTPLPERVAGYDLMRNLLNLANEHKLKIYLLGAKEETIIKTEENIKKEYPEINLVGAHNGFFDWDDSSIAESIQSVQPDIVFVALGVPRQEQWIYENLDRFDKGIFIGVGGSFDVIAGNVKRAPESWQRLNLEWLYRLLKQPSRWKRTLVLPLFVIKVLLKRGKEPSSK